MKMRKYVIKPIKMSGKCLLFKVLPYIIYIVTWWKHKGNVSKNIDKLIKIIDDNKYNIESYNNFRDKYTPKVKSSVEEIYKIISENL